MSLNVVAEFLPKYPVLLSAGPGINITNNGGTRTISSGTYSDRDQIKAISNQTSGSSVFLSEEGREGIFVWTTGDFTGLADVDTNEGAFLISDDTPVTDGAWVRYFEGDLIADWFGAVGDGATDDYTAIAAAISIGNLLKKNVRFLGKTYCHTQTIVLNVPVKLIGAGVTHPAWNGYATPTSLTTLKFTGSVGTSNQVTVPHVNFGGGIKYLTLDGNSRSNRGLLVSSSNGAEYKFIYIKGNRLKGAEFTGHPSGDTCSWNHVTSLFIDQDTGDYALSIDRDVPTDANACHILFENLRINFGGTAHGIYIRGADNCCFVLPYIYAAPGATGYGVYLTPSDNPFFPINNTIYHLQASTRGLYQEAGCDGRTVIVYGYMTDNGQPPPVNLSPVYTLVCSDMPCTPSIAPVIGSGWSGAAVGINAYTVRCIDENHFHVRAHLEGSGGGTFSASANATVTNMLDNFSGWGNVTGINLNGQLIHGYYQNGVVTLMSGVTNTTGAVLEFTVSR